MGDFLKSIQKFLFSPWAMWVISILGAIAIFRPYWFYDPSALVSAELISNTPVFNVQKNIGKLTVLYDGQDITRSGGAIYSLTVTVVNKGKSSVKKGDYDEKFPLGIEIEHGTILEDPVVRASNDYLKDALKIFRVSANSVSVSPVILDPQDSFTLTFLILGARDRQVMIKSLGKIAGQGAIAVTDISEKAQKKSFWAEMIAGDLLIHFARSILYIFVVLLFVVALVWILMMICLPVDLVDNYIDRREQRKRKEIANEYLRSRKLIRTPLREMVFSAYINQVIRQESVYTYLLDLVEGKIEFTEELVKNALDDSKIYIRIHSGPGVPVEGADVSAGESRKYLRARRFLDALKDSEVPWQQAVAEIKETLIPFLEYLYQIGAPRRQEVVSRSFEGPFYKGRRGESVDLEWTVADV